MNVLAAEEREPVSERKREMDTAAADQARARLALLPETDDQR
jgi:hypothetical protein